MLLLCEKLKLKPPISKTSLAALKDHNEDISK
jgi:hypothetical protein